MSFKFSGRGLAVEVPTRVKILHPVTGQPMVAVIGEQTHECYVEGYSTDSRAAAAFQAGATDRATARRGRRATPAEMDAEFVDLLVALTTGWCLVSPEGDLIDEPFSAGAARELYGLPEWKFLREQVVAGLGDRGNFTRKSAAS
jgi:hypothetical protein